MTEIYQSKERYTVNVITDMGVTLNQVVDSKGLVCAVLNDEAFNAAYTVVSDTTPANDETPPSSDDNPVVDEGNQ